MKRFIIIILGLLIYQTVFAQRLTMTKEEIADKKCEIVAQYFEFKKYVSVIADRTEIPRIRNSNEIALFRLLSANFTTSEMGGGNRDIFLRELKNQSNTFGLLKRTYETFDCPNFGLVQKSSPLSSDIMDEVHDMNIIDPGKEVLTTRYRGSLFYSEVDMESFDVGSTIITKATKGIQKKPKIKELKYEMYKLTEETYVIKIREINKIDKAELLVAKGKKDSTLVRRIVDLDPDDFIPCCDQPEPPDSDGDSYNDLVDCDPNNKAIHPGATEIIADGIDQDCDGKDQLGEDYDSDGYTVEACKSENPEIRKLCDCNDKDRAVHYRSPNTPKDKWFNPHNGWNDDNCDCIIDEEPIFNWANLGSSDYIVVGKGHLKRGHSNPAIRNGFAIFYGTSFLASSGYAVYSKLRSNEFYDDHKAAETIRSSNENYEKANRHHKHFLISTGIAGLIFSAQYAHLKISDNRQKEYYRDVFEGEKLRGLDSESNCVISLQPTISDNYIGYGLVVKL